MSPRFVSAGWETLAVRVFGVEGDKDEVVELTTIQPSRTVYCRVTRLSVSRFLLSTWEPRFLTGALKGRGQTSLTASTAYD